MIKTKHPFVGEFLESLINDGYDTTWKKYKEEVNNHKEYDFNDICDFAEWIKGSATNDHDIDVAPPKQINMILKKLL